MSFKLGAIKDDSPKEKVVISNEITTDTRVEINPKVLEAYWKAYADKLSHEENGGYLSSMLMRHAPQVKSYNVFQVEVAHDLEKDQFIENKMRILSYLRLAMKIPSLELDVIISDKQQETTKAYTSKDKFKIMAEKNPALNKFKDDLGLEIEY